VEKNTATGKTAFPKYPPIEKRPEIGDVVKKAKAVSAMLDACAYESGMGTEETETVMLGCRNVLNAAIDDVERWGYDVENDVYVIYADHPNREEVFHAIYNELHRQELDRDHPKVSRDIDPPLAAS
jgi:hypothetical protein